MKKAQLCRTNQILFYEDDSFPSLRSNIFSSAKMALLSNCACHEAGGVDIFMHTPPYNKVSW